MLRSEHLFILLMVFVKDCGGSLVVTGGGGGGLGGLGDLVGGEVDAHVGVEGDDLAGEVGLVAFPDPNSSPLIVLLVSSVRPSVCLYHRYSSLINNL